MNEDGDVLCRTQYTENPMGSHDYTPSVYGLCVLTKGRIIEYPLYKLNYYLEYSSLEEYLVLESKWNEYTKSPFNKETSIVE